MTSALRRQSLCHLHLGAVINGPGCLMCNRFDHGGSGWMAIAAAFDAAEWQVHLGADARQVDISHAVLAFVAEIAHGSIILGDDGKRQAIARVVVNADGILIAAEGHQSQMRAEDFFPKTSDAGSMIEA